MNKFHLTPDGGRWKLTGGGEGTILSFETKERAVQACAEYMAGQTGSLKIHRADGTVEEERTYPRSADPVKSPG